MKGSVNTFLNAMTFPDRTAYPVASCNLADFYNLVDVYLDAVLHPKCVDDEMTFKQEGWHLELNPGEEEVTLKGVVFNEMKGVYSQPDSFFYRTLQNELFPDNTYRVDSGGDPQVIPDLSFTEFRNFHKQFYHPSNARFWFYGDDEPEKRLEILAGFLDDFEPLPQAVEESKVVPQKMWTEPRVKVTSYPVGLGGSGEEEEGHAEGGDSSTKAFASVNWILAEEDLDLETQLALGFLDYLMTGTSASPLRKALNDSGLGASMIGGGLDDDLLQPCYSIGLKGVAPEDATKVQELVMTTLAKLEKDGFPEGAVEAAINTIEFSLRENNTGSFPRGLSLMFRAMSAWIYDRDPYANLVWEEPLAAFKARLAKQSTQEVFGALIRAYLLDNKHRLDLTMVPDAGLGREMEAAEKARIAQAAAAMSESDRAALVTETVQLRERQEKPDSPEALRCIPALSLADMPKTISTVPTTVTQQKDGETVLRNDLFTNEVVYMELALDMSGVPAALLPLVPLFCRSLTQMATETESFVELTERMGRKTGGLSVSRMINDVRGQIEPAAYVLVRGKAMASKFGDLTDLARDILLTSGLNDKDRFVQMVTETKASLEASMVGSGHAIAMGRLSSQRTVAGWASEATGGLSYYDFICELLPRAKYDWDAVRTDLLAIRSALLQRAGAVVNLTADAGSLTKVDGAVKGLLASLPATATGSGTASGLWTPTMSRTNEALVVPTQVNYVGKAVNMYQDAGYELSGAAYVISKHVGNSYLWDRVRVSGGAYGGFCDFNQHSGQFTFLSYRDPNLVATLDNYDGAPDFLRSMELDQDSLTKTIIGTIGDVDAYQLPDAKGYGAFMRHILGVSDGERQERRDQILSTTVADFRKFADYLDAIKTDEASVVAVCSGDAAKKAKEARPTLFNTIRKVL